MATDKGGSTWANLSKEHNLSKFLADLAGVIKTAGYDEMYGVTLVPPAEG